MNYTVKLLLEGLAIGVCALVLPGICVLVQAMRASNKVKRGERDDSNLP